MSMKAEGLYSDKNDDISNDERQSIARVCSVIQALADCRILIHGEMINHAYNASLDYSCLEILTPSVKKVVIERAIDLAQEDVEMN